MRMYIEDYLFQQIITTFCLIRLLTITTKHQTSIKRILFVISIDAIFALIVATSQLNYYLNNILILVEPFVLVCFLYKNNLKQKALSYFIFQFFSLSIKGIIINFASSTFYSSVGIITYTKYSPLILISAIIIFSYIYESILNNAKLRIKSNSLIYKLNLYQNNKRFSLNAYIDTGNLANIDGKGLIIIDYITFLNLQSCAEIMFKPKETITINTINTNGKISVYTVDKIEIGAGKEKKIYSNHPIGVTYSNIFSNKNYKALISPELI